MSIQTETVDWYTSVIFKGSDNLRKMIEVSVPKTDPIAKFAIRTLDNFGIKDVLATVEFTKYNGNTNEINTIVDPDVVFWDAVQAYGYTSTVYTDAEFRVK